MEIIIETIPISKMRYKSVGDWFWEPTLHGGRLIIKVAKLSDERFEHLVAVHELIEVLLCKQAGVSQEAVDKFDMDFEATRKPGDLSEPGDQPTAPYFRQHRIASAIEALLAVELGVDWQKYASEVESL